MEEERHELMDGRLYLFRRVDSQKWQSAAFLDGRNWRKATGETNLALAKAAAEEWYLGLRGMQKVGSLKTGKKFKDAAEQFLREYEVITGGQRSPFYVKTLEMKLRVHLAPFFGNRFLSDITAGLVQEYRIHRMTSKVDEETGEPIKPARSTLHHEIITLRHVLKTAHRHGWLTILPDLSPPYQSNVKISHRGWFSLEEYKALYKATRDRIQNPRNPRWKNAAVKLHDYVLFMANTGLRPDEAKQLQFRDVAIVSDQATRARILEIEVRGKRGVGYCKNMPGAVLPFKRLRDRNRGGPEALVFGKIQRELFNAILEELNLKFDRDGNRRSAYSLRHTYICLRLLEGADIYQVAKNCRTSVEMIEKYYASHLKNTIDASAINVRKPRSRIQPEETDEE
jgi:integrase